jgi:hypothetical protein
MCFDTNNSLNEGINSNNNVESGSNNDSDLVEKVEEEMGTDWFSDAIDYYNVQVTFQNVGKSSIQELKEKVDLLRNCIVCNYQAQSFESK